MTSMSRPGRRAVALVAPPSLCCGSRSNSDNGCLHRFAPSPAARASSSIAPRPRGFYFPFRQFLTGGESLKFLAQNIWLLGPVQGKIKEFFADFAQLL